MNWEKIRNKKEFVTLLRSVTVQRIVWCSLYARNIAWMLRLSGWRMHNLFKIVPLGTHLIGICNKKEFITKKEIKIFAPELGERKNLPKKGDSFFENNSTTLWSVDPLHPLIKKLMRKYNLKQKHLESIEMCNDHAILQRLAFKNILPPPKLYKDEKFVKKYLLEISEIIEESMVKEKFTENIEELIYVEK